jgi:hypothetical protein
MLREAGAILQGLGAKVTLIGHRHCGEITIVPSNIAIDPIIARMDSVFKVRIFIWHSYLK